MRQRALLPETVLMPGDPLRAKHIAETFLDDAVCVNTVRNMFGYTGTYKGKPVSVLGSAWACRPCLFMPLSW
ncbi:Purine nucleoside phosphorylase DeoD-type 1 [Alishewanella longhuensis]